jgi:phosphatidylethanolamine-binding protein (PEBP) family uncharacterized protein
MLPNVSKIFHLNKVPFVGLFCSSLICLFLFSCKKDTSNSTTPLPPVTSAFTLTSAAVSNGFLLDAYKCEAKVGGIEKNLPLVWTNAPSSANAFIINMIHYPNANDSSIISSYLELWGIDKTVTEIPYGKANAGTWFIGPNKDLNVISYTSPCSAGAGTHTYIITIYAVSATPASLPKANSLTVTYPVLKAALATVTIVGKAVLTFKSVTP